MFPCHAMLIVSVRTVLALCDRHALQLELQHPTSLPQEPPRFLTVLVALRQRQQRSVVATDYLCVVSASPTLDIYQPLNISSICCLC